jgi:hypothetical protein
VIYFTFNLLRIKGLYMFLPLLGHSQEVLHKRHLIYCVRIMSVGCATIAARLGTISALGRRQRTQDTRTTAEFVHVPREDGLKENPKHVGQN